MGNFIGTFRKQFVELLKRCGSFSFGENEHASGIRQLEGMR